MAISDAVRLLAVPTKRVRERKYSAFGDLLKEWRNGRDIETVVRLVRSEGVNFDDATLRGWEYGWTGRPDPLSLLALAKVYGRSVGDVMSALANGRGVTGRDLLRHAGTKGLSSHQKEKGESD